LSPGSQLSFYRCSVHNGSMSATQPSIEINANRLWKRIEVLSRITDPAKPWTRRSFDDNFAKGRIWLETEFKAAGLSVAVDSGGNLIGRREGSKSGSGALVSGSHSDTVPAGGRFDGVLGLLAALEAAQSMHEQHISLLHPLEVVDFLAEEPSDFGLSCIGSRSWAGALTASDLALRSSDITLASAIDKLGGHAEEIRRAMRPHGSVSAYVELHIEQGLVLPERNAAIGVVTAIAGIRRYEVTVEGRADHAGTTPMSLRRDALVGAASVIRMVDELARTRSPQRPYLVATIGKISAEPNAINAVPGSVRMILETRSTEDAELADFEQQLWQKVEPELQPRGLSLKYSPMSKTVPTACSPLIQEAIEQAATSAGLHSTHLPSGAGHDGVFVARIAPMGMIFVPCRDGRSHAPEEWAEPADCANGARVLAKTLLLLDRKMN
jgi:beta-ureidopropionase / N-carbamoyl-L-amino-acid hydrolase